VAVIYHYFLILMAVGQVEAKDCLISKIVNIFIPHLVYQFISNHCQCALSLRHGDVTFNVQTNTVGLSESMFRRCHKKRVKNWRTLLLCSYCAYWM